MPIDEHKIIALEEKQINNHEQINSNVKTIETHSQQIEKINKQLYGNGDMKGSILFILNNMSQNQLASSNLINTLINRFDDMEKLILGGMNNDDVGLKNEVKNLKKEHETCRNLTEIVELAKKVVENNEKINKIETTISNMKYFIGIGIPFLIVGIQILIKVIMK